MRALLKKNFLIKRRSLGSTLVEFFYPVYFAVILAVITLSNASAWKSYSAAVASPDTPFPLVYPSSLAAVPSPLVSAFLSTHGLSAVLFSSLEELTAVMSVSRNGSGPLFANALYATASGSSEVIHIVGPPFLDVRSASVALATMWVNVSLDWASMTRAKEDVAPFAISYLLWPIYFCFMLFFAVVAMLVLLINERENNLKLTIQLTGVRDTTYFLSHVIVQLIIQLASTAVLLLIIFLSGSVKYQAPLNMICVFVAFVLSCKWISLSKVNFLSLSFALLCWLRFLLGGKCVYAV
jgi:hypothetical protein